MPDRYRDFATLAANNDEGADFRIRHRLADSPIAIVAPHGGGIEAGTSELADAVAGREHSFYAFEGIRGHENVDLHITGTRFDEPRGLQVLAHADIVVAMHGRDRDDEVVFLGGLHLELIEHLAAALERAGFRTSRDDRPAYAGTDPDNICNRGRLGRGVQLELPRGLRLRLFPALNAAGRRVRTCRFRRFRNVLRGALREWVRTHPRAAVPGPASSFVALVREVSPRLAACELTHLARQPIDFERARSQHAAYVDLLASLGCAVRSLPPAPDLPDSVFVEDTAVVFDELAIVTRPGAASRRAETATVDPVLREYRPVRVIEAPGTLDGGDVLVAGKQVYVGLSSRSNTSAVDQVRRWMEPAGYQVRGIAVQGCLHLKSAVAAVGDRLLLINPAWIDRAAFGDMGIVEVDPAEPQAANALRVGGAVIVPESFPATRARLEAAGVVTRGIDLSELAKAEGAVTCCSLIFRKATAATPAPLPA
jgi:dimethylargininase